MAPRLGGEVVVLERRRRWSWDFQPKGGLWAAEGVKAEAGGRGRRSRQTRSSRRESTGKAAVWEDIQETLTFFSTFTAACLPP